MALRYHCGKGDLEWVSLLLSAGANPYENGLSKPDDKTVQIAWSNVLEIAILYKNFEIFELKKLKRKPKLKKNKEIFRSVCLRSYL